MKNLPNRLKRLRECYKFTVLEAEWVCGISRSALNTWERGTRMPSADGLYQIATAYGVSMDWLCGIISSPYTLESLETAESIHISENSIDEVQRNMIIFPTINGKSVGNFALFNDYFKHKGTFSLEARANVLVLILFINGLHSYLNKHSGFVLTSQQHNHRCYIETALLSVLSTKHPVTLQLN